MTRPRGTQLVMLGGVSLLAVALAAGCDDDRRATAPTTARSAGGGGNAPVLEMEMRPVTPLLPHRPTHVTLDPQGNIYWVQETDRGDDTMFVIGQGDIPRATQLSAANIAALLGADGGRGNIHGIAAAPAGGAGGPGGAGSAIYFYFAGAKGRQALAALGTFHPRTATVRILAAGDAVAAATGMGRSLPLARASVVSDGRAVWAWLRHTDAWAVFRIDPARVPASGPATLQRAFTTVTVDAKPLELTREDMEIAPAPGGSLFLLHPGGGQLLTIAPSGNASVARSLVGLPGILSTPAVDASGKLMIFAANAALIGARADSPAARTDATFPALLIFEGDRVRSIGRDHMIAYPGFPVFGTRLRQLVPAPDGTWISYDAGFGELLRLKIREKAW